MKIELNELSPVKRTMTVEVEAGVVAAETDEVVRRYAVKARIPGFRPGKAPLSVVRSRFKKEVEEEVRESLLHRLYGEAAKEKGITPIGDPALDEVVFEEGKPFSFKTSFEIRPEINPQGYEGVEVPKKAAAVSDEDVETALGEIRDSRAQLVVKEGKAETGDFLMADVAGTPEGGEPFQQENALVEIGSTQNLPEFNDRIEGAGKGDSLEFSVNYPQEHPAEQLAGKDVAYQLTVHEVKTRELPELDDEFAKDLGEFDSLDALKERVRTDLTARKKAETDNEMRKILMDKIVVENPAELPDVLVEEEIRHRMEDMVRTMMMQGVDPQKIDVDWKEIRERQDEPARKAVHARLVLDAIADEKGLAVEDKEVDEKIQVEAARIGEPATEVRKRLVDSGGTGAIKVQLLREKALEWVVAAANIQEEE
ncbi:MAG: trigger factor [Acidobacteria bacterium]|uniref:Trigger factor n=1 Tax=Candidatus Polarisedimenticola svalbardensis TaxID=2886004 RepID=A0A8J7CK33_9BACT|nr:trigger factor [Candidatus Polarisedimenticola svalbardensis]